MVKRYLEFEVVSDGRWLDKDKYSDNYMEVLNQIHSEKVEKIAKDLEKISAFTVFNPITYVDKGVPIEDRTVHNYQIRTTIWVINKNKGITWNKVMETINQTYAPYYEYKSKEKGFKLRKEVVRGDISAIPNEVG